MDGMQGLLWAIVDRTIPVEPVVPEEPPDAAEAAARTAQDDEASGSVITGGGPQPVISRGVNARERT
jgi:hypothetical protein